MLKATLKQPGVSTSEADKDAVLLRAYGKGTGVLIDRDREFFLFSVTGERGKGREGEEKGKGREKGKEEKRERKRKTKEKGKQNKTKENC